MAFATPFTAHTGDVITANGHNDGIRDPILWLRGLLPDPGSAGLPLVSTSTSAATFAQLATAGIADDAVTSAKIAANTITNAQIANNTIGNSQLVGGTAVANLGYTPSRIVSGTYSGTNASSGRRVTTGFAVKLVVIHESSADTMYIAVGTTNSLRLAPSSVQGSSSVHLHASDGFVVGDGTVQGNVSGTDNYTYTAFG